MKKFILSIVAVIAFVGMFASCDGKSTTNVSNDSTAVDSALVDSLATVDSLAVDSAKVLD